MHPICGALPVQYVPVTVTRGALVAHRYTDASPRCRTSWYRSTFISLSVSLWNDLADPLFDGVGLAGSQSRVDAFSLATDVSFFFIFYCCSFLSSISIGWYCGARAFGLKWCQSLFTGSIALLPFFNNDNYIPALLRTSSFRTLSIRENPTKLPTNPPNTSS